MNISELSASELAEHGSAAGEAALHALFGYMEDHGLTDDLKVAIAIGTVGALLFVEAIREANRGTVGREMAMEVELHALDIVAAFKQAREDQKKRES